MSYLELGSSNSTSLVAFNDGLFGGLEGGGIAGNADELANGVQDELGLSDEGSLVANLEVGEILGVDVGVLGQQPIKNKCALNGSGFFKRNDQ